MKKIVVISGSPSQTSRIHGVIDEAMAQLEEKGFSVEHLSVAQLPAEDLLYAKFNSEAVVKANALVAEADAIIVATPVYKAAYTGILKAYLDLLPQKGLEGKVILPIAMGGTTAHLLMLEYALKPVLSVLGATQIEQGVFVQDSQAVWNQDGRLEMSAEVSSRFTAAMNQFAETVGRSVTV